jgi:hypothetical protein
VFAERVAPLEGHSQAGAYATEGRPRPPANYLLTGHPFRPGAYQVGGPIGLVYYYAKHQELRLGQPLTITKANLGLYAHKF